MSEDLFLHLKCARCQTGLGLFVEPVPCADVVKALCSLCAPFNELRVEPIDPGQADQQEA